MPEFAYSFNYAAAIRLSKKQGNLIKIEWDKITYPTAAKLFIFYYNRGAENVAKKRRILFALHFNGKKNSTTNNIRWQCWLFLIERLKRFMYFFSSFLKRVGTKRFCQIYAIYFGCYLLSARILLFFSIIKLATWVNKQRGNK